MGVIAVLKEGWGAKAGASKGENSAHKSERRYRSVAARTLLLLHFAKGLTVLRL
jgi:hypothetical protein